MKGVTGRGQTRGSVGASPTGIEIGIDVKVGQLGISTDYGGGIVVAIFGQKIVWGREGGKIHYKFAGFEVLVEARNCIIVETKKIAGIIVSRHTYPDPGCKLPEPPDPPLTPQPIIADPDIGIEVPGTDQLFWVLCIFKRKYYNTFGAVVSEESSTPTISNKEEDIVSSTRMPFEIGVYIKRPSYNPYTLYGTKHTLVAKGTFFTGNAGLDPRFRHPEGSAADVRFFYISTSTNSIAGGYIDTGIRIKNFLNKLRENEERLLRSPRAFIFGSAYSLHHIPQNYIPVGNQKIIPQPLAGNQPPMPDSCCQAVLADLADLKQVFATKEILAGELTFPWDSRMPGGKGEEVIMDYPNLLRAISQLIDHLGIHPPKLSVKDINNAVAGDQGLSNQFPSATQGFEALMAQVWDANADTDTLTNILYRLSWLCVQQSMNLGVISGKVQTLVDMIGGETELSESSITTPFNISAGVTDKTTRGKGFGKEINKKIEAKTEIATESLLPDFLKIRENPIMVEVFSGKQDLFDKLTLLTLKIETLQNSLKG